MSKPIGIGMAAIGGYARQHLTVIRTLQDFGHCTLKAAFDPFAAKQPATLATLKSEGVAVYDNFDSLLERDDIEAVTLATPIHLHARQAIAALEAGKHVYLEKPPCVTLAEYSRIEAAQKSSGKQCVVGFQMQTSPAQRYLKKRLVAGDLGELRTVWAAIRWRRNDDYYNRNNWAGRWRADGYPVFDGPATNALSHVVHAALCLAGESDDDWARVQRVRGVLKKARPLESYDSCLLETETQSGVQVKLAFTHATSHSDEVVFHCEGDGGRASLTWGGSLHIEPHDAPAQHLQFEYDPRFGAMLNFLEVVRNPSVRPTTRLQDTLPYLQTVNGVLQSSNGSSFFAPELTEYSDGVYRVQGLDEQFENFAADSSQPPPLLADAPMKWIDADDIQTELNF